MAVRLNTMRITKIQSTPVNVPLEAPFFWSVGVYPGTTKVVLEVFTDEGLIGLGEAPSIHCWKIIEERLAPRLIGADAFDIETCERLCVPDTRADYNSDDRSVLKAFGGVEMALWDLRGKAWDLPLYKLLGGAVRKEIPFTEYFALREKRGVIGGEKTPKDVAAYCARMHERHGSTCFEGKCAPGDPCTTVGMVREIRKALGDEVIIRLDANMGYSLDTACDLIVQLGQYRLSNFEDPVPSFFEMAKLRQHTYIPFSTHLPDLKLAVRLGVPDNFVLNLTQLGGIQRTRNFVAACEEMGVGFWCYSGETGIGSAAYLHFIAASQYIRQPSQSLFRWQTDDVIEEGPFRPQANVLPVPEGPGLGITLSPSSLQRCHERFLEEGPYDEYYDPANPGKYIRLPIT